MRVVETWSTKPLWDDADWKMLEDDEAEASEIHEAMWAADDLQAAVRRHGGRLPGSDPRR